MSESATGPIAKLGRWLAQSRTLLEQKLEIDRLREEVTRLEERNARIERAMRRCVPCEYRLEVIARRGGEGGVRAEESDVAGGSAESGAPARRVEEASTG